ncbi:NUDIX domain-containing protein [Massilia luteola]|uniref:NUDIX domain-containing protein n=1 Tax=Massilia luteola TaxID=3081751 RepID=UPI002ACBEF3F|nr:NUDIX domain-containing protein [Massilia sp. Gc5]
MSSDTVRIVREEILSDHYLPLKNVTYALRRHDGDLQVQSREVYDSADGAAVLLYNRTHRSVVLTRQFRVGARLAGHDGFLLEAAAGTLDGADPATRALAEAREETGYDIDRVQAALRLYASPASTTERIHLFVAEYERERRRDGGGGNAGEGEDIEVVELDFDDALAMVETGDIVDAKTVLLLMYLERKVLGRHGEAS